MEIISGEFRQASRAENDWQDKAGAGKGVGCTLTTVPVLLVRVLVCSQGLLSEWISSRTDWHKEAGLGSFLVASCANSHVDRMPPAYDSGHMDACPNNVTHRDTGDCKLNSHGSVP